MTNVILAESSRDAVLAAVSLARRIPGGAELAFSQREHLDGALTTPAHAARRQPYRLIVVGPDLAPEWREPMIAAFAADRAEQIWWLDANEWTEEGARAVGGLVRGGGEWINRPRTHHPFPAVDAASSALALGDDPFSATLQSIAEGSAHREWQDALDMLAGRPHELPESVKPLLHGMIQEIGVVDRGEGEAARAEIDTMLAGSRFMRVPLQGSGDTTLQGVLLVLPDAGSLPVIPLAAAAIAVAGVDAGVILFDRGDFALLVGRRHGSEPPTSVSPAMEAVTRLGWARRDRLAPGFGVIRMVGRPKDALERLVAGLVRD